MQWARSNRRLSAWVALFAILLMSLAPTLSHGLQGEAGRGWAEVCTAGGTNGVDAAGRADGQAPASQPSQAHVFEHCPYCSLQAGGIGMPPAPLAWALAPGVFQAPRLFLAAPRTLPVWLAAQPRAPPSRG